MGRFSPGKILLPSKGACRVPRYDLSRHGIVNVGHEYWNLGTPALYEQVVRHREGIIAHKGPIVVRTGGHTGRSPNDKFVVRETSTQGEVWWGDVNKAFDEARFESLFHRMTAYLQGKDLFVQDCRAGAHPDHKVYIRVITETAWHSLFARNMFIQCRGEDLENFEPDYTIINAPNFHAKPDVDGTRSETFIILNFAKRLILIGGTSYAGEIKKSVFTLLNYLLPTKNVMPMHCSANRGPDGDTALFFGLSGTGKTTLSADPRRDLIGDDEHGWAPDGIFNFEGGCYAKVIKLSKESEPEIYETTRRFGTILENVGFADPNTRRLDLDDDSLTENTRAAYPLTHIPHALIGGVYQHPKNILMLACDAFSVLPPISRLSTGQAMYHFLSGYTAKVAGTEKGLGKEPQATFSTCFGAPFMVHHPTTYALLLKKYIETHDTHCWLVNTGWSGGPYGEGRRMKIEHTRALVNFALDGSLATVPTRIDPTFGFEVPLEVPGVPKDVLDPRATWKDPDAYDRKARELAGRFVKNYEQFTGEIAESVAQYGPAAK
ncbi:MAG: phosphoenolpyruvate carboxykinase (ATP) [Deltaproteobacteria bacterium]|nr:phosphoenolpyruvate carboxykinase (ATP) [Deltaproteobacteria bacterium]